MHSTIYSGGIKQTQTHTPRQVLDILEEAIEKKVNFIVYLLIPGTHLHAVSITAKQLAAAVRYVWKSGKNDSVSYEVIHYPASGELYIFEANKVLTEQSTTSELFEAIQSNDDKDREDAKKYRLIGKAAEALNAAATLNGIPVDALIPMVQYLASKLTFNPRFKK